MKQLVRSLLLLSLTAGVAQAQNMQYFRPYDKTGINVFETTKADTSLFEGLKVRVGGGFTQDYQMLDASNTANFVPWKSADSATLKSSGRLADLAAGQTKPLNLTNGFNLAMANMFVDAQLDDGIRVNLTVYLSARHHNESWVKNGYLQIDKLKFFHSDAVDNIMKDLTLRVGQVEVDYGDQHFRRTDGGHAMYNPFAENYIMDEFATEIGGEIYYHPLESGILAMAGVTNGMLNSTVIEATTVDAVTKSPNAYNPAFHFKLGYDKSFSKEMRVRLTGSLYTESSTSSSTLFGGDRTGSHYFMVLENLLATTAGNPTSGRFNPGFSDQVTTFMINPFIKFGGLEIFGTYEQAKGRTVSEVDQRKASQLAADVLYRFGANDDFWVGGRYNTVKATLAGKTPTDVTINRIAASAGYFITNNMLLKAEYVNQEYKDFAPTDIRNGGKFSGLMVEATIGF